MAMNIKKTDTVVVTTGKDSGKKGKVLRAFPSKAQVLVEGVNEHKKHERAKKAGQKGQTITKIFPVAVSNVMLWCSSCGRGVRFGNKRIDGKNLRICKRCGAEI